MIRSVLLDVGGTLIEAPDIFHEIAKHFRLSDDQRDNISIAFNKLYHNNQPSDFKTVTEMLNNAFSQVTNKSDSMYNMYWNTYVNDSISINSSNAFFKKLSSINIEQLVVTDADANLIYCQFEKFGWMPYVSKFFISSEMKAYKPDNSIVDLIKSYLGIYRRNEIAIIGDSKCDIELGKKLNICTILISKNDILNYGQDYTIQDLLQVLDLNICT